MPSFAFAPSSLPSLAGFSSFRSESVRIVLHDDYLEMNWSGPVGSEAYREGWEKALAAAKRNRIYKWLFNQKEMFARLSDLKWSREDWFPRSVEALGLNRKVAVVVAKDVFVRYQQQKALGKTQASDSGWQCEYFQDAEKARRWLNS